jgi:DNA-damage-inducible protein J
LTRKAIPGAAKGYNKCIDNVRTFDYEDCEVKTMAKTANLNIRVDPETKLGAERLFSNFGITVTDAVNIFLRQSLMVGGLPFEMKQPRFNQETETALREARDIASGKIVTKSYSSAKELFTELDAKC